MEFYKWCEGKYGSELNGHVKLKEGLKHNYQAMTLDYTEKRIVRIDMEDYVKEIINTFPYNLLINLKCPWTTRLFNLDKEPVNIDL